jgi:hypothetical protein
LAAAISIAPAVISIAVKTNLVLAIHPRGAIPSPHCCYNRKNCGSGSAAISELRLVWNRKAHAVVWVHNHG